MTAEQIEIIKALGTCSMLPGSWDKRFTGSMQLNITNNRELTEKSNEWMYRLLYKYRKQIPEMYNKYSDNQFCSRKEKK